LRGSGEVFKTQPERTMNYASIHRFQSPEPPTPVPVPPEVPPPDPSHEPPIPTREPPPGMPDVPPIGDPPPGPGQIPQSRAVLSKRRVYRRVS
jgi:hypothetical protein